MDTHHPALSVQGVPEATGDGECPYRVMNHGVATCITKDEYLRYSGYGSAVGFAAASFFLSFGSLLLAGERPNIDGAPASTG